MRSLPIGIIDSGIDPSQRVQASQGFSLQDGKVISHPASPDRLSHGEQLLEIIQNLAPGCAIHAAQVFSDRLVTTAAQLDAALAWLLDQQVVLINLSLGLRQDNPVLRDACEQAIAGGVILCASTPARGDPVWPAAYPGVWRITGDSRCGPGEFSWLASPHADLGGCVRSIDGGTAGASMACAHLSGHIARYLSQGGKPTDLAHWLRQTASFHGPPQR